MKNCKIIIGLLSILFLPNLVFSQWIELNSGTTQTLNDVYFLNTELGYVVGQNGSILKTSDGGDNWEIQNSGTDLDLTSVYFPTIDTGYVVGAVHQVGFIILKTIDGGQTWYEQTNILNPDPYIEYVESPKIRFLSVNKGIIIHPCGFIFTIDGGNTWKFITSTQLRGTQIDLIDENGVAVFDNELTFFSFNEDTIVAEETTHSIPLFETSINSISLTDTHTAHFTSFMAGIGKISSGFYELLLEEQAMMTINQIFYITPSTGYTVGNVIMKTTNSGYSWDTIAHESGRSVFFINQNVGYVVGYNGKIIKTINGGIVGVYNTGNKTSFDVFPNPCSEDLFIETEQTQYTLQITTLLGNTIFEEKNITHLDLIDFSSGIYIVNLITPEITLKKQIVIY